jgi:hypothetical protein
MSSSSQFSTYYQTGRNLPDLSSAASVWQSVVTDVTTKSVTSDLTSSYQIFTYESGTCFVETNINYMSNQDDTIAEYFTYSFEKCCSDCNRLSGCLSWTYEQEAQMCTLKKSFRPSPSLVRGFTSGFKPNDLFSLSISRGLEFLNVTNPVYEQLSSSHNASNANSSTFYEYVKSYLEYQVNL